MTTFTEVFQARLEAIEKRAEANGFTMTDLCRKTGVARATPDRWRERAPQSVAKVDVLEAELDRLIAGKAAQ
ncbi:hypothetical protein CHELA1G11_10869 [Hyphomicrobiales bacterium]|nr:hypothetical protein CHELA1G11_10869 [Hyphomicrobiales bacterium]CAH1671739.1 hypothetical protein CHELA1G2_13439 [Hyphomicrobiales bacterium]